MSIHLPSPDAFTEQYRELFEDAPVAYHELDCDGIIRRVNRAECFLFGYLPEELIGRSVFDLVDPDLQERGRANLCARISGIRPPGVFRSRFRTCDGGVVFLEIHDCLIRDSGGAVCGIRSMQIDISERVEAEAELVRSRSRLQTVLESIADAVVAFDALGTVTICNRAAAALFGVDARTVIGCDAEEVFPFAHMRDERGVPCDFAALLLYGIAAPFCSAISLLRADGTTLPLRFTASPIETDDGHVAGVVVVLTLVR